MIIPVAEFAPDMPNIPTSGASDTVSNVIPLTNASYGPLPSLAPISGALTARCQGAISATDTAGNVRVFAGDAAKLYRSTDGTTFADVSKVSGYATPGDGVWSSTVFGTRIIETNYIDAPQSYIEGSSTLFDDLISSGVTSLKGRYVATVRDFVALFNTVDVDGTHPQRVHWSAINDPTNFPPPGTQDAANALSDFQDVVGTHGRGMGIVGNLGTGDAALFFERAVFRMIFAGLPDIFDIVPVQGAKGLLAPGGLVQFGSLAFYPAEDGFYAFDGSDPIPIGKNKVDRFFLNDVDYSYLDRMSSAVDSTRNLIIWSYVGAGATLGVPNRLLIYSPNLGRWTITEAGSVSAERLLRGYTFGKTLEQLDAFGTLDTLPYSLDSNVWVGGLSALAAFDSNHKFGYFNGPSMAAIIDSSDGELAQSMQSRVNRIRPLVDTTAATVATCSRDKLADMKLYTSDNAMQRDGSVPVRGRGRYLRARTKIPAGTAWTHFSGIDIEDAVARGRN